ncbi:MAG: adenylyl-sulfate kinase [Chitinophagales bacterium]|nr:adenylyl-sulfate kinase [Chitinophagales bacterium]HAE12834.1 adenylyl-sulfate kinase [Bacteroidota bacterium]MCB9021491.1 adenylyl-sulfate kinase [Chitinophagales bacterium]MCB9031992.1 adenylyl-sulfate kinase [Chitinophagales bacterium]HAE34935.1 adenylyl-sulfate kinase [Bacteroidota bacterium]
MSVQEHIHPIFDRILQRSDKEALLRQRAKVIWLTGLSGSGKSTIAQHIEKELHQRGLLTMLLDGDNIRSGINNNLSFSDTDRIENIRRIAEVSKLFLNCGIITLNSFVSPTNEIREMARNIIGAEDFLEVYINAPLEVCEARDVKGLYAKARKGLIPDFTGITAPFEAPEHPALEIRTDQMSVKESVRMLLDFILPIIQQQA